MQLQGNSDKSKQEPAQEKSSDVPAVPEEKLSPFMTAFTMIFSDTPKNIAKNFLKYRLVPCFSDFLHQIGTNFLDEAFNGKSNSDPREYRDNRVKRSGNYDRYQDQLKRNSLTAKNREKRQINYKDLTWRTRTEAERVLGLMKDELLRHPSGVSIAKMFEFYNESLIEGEDYPYTYNGYGWTDLGGVDVKLSGVNDYYIDLPKPEEL